MKSHTEVTIGFAILLLVAGSGCSEAPSEAAATASGRPKIVIKADSVGNYQIGTSTLGDILGEDTQEKRKQFAARGLHFEFEIGNTLKGITIDSDEYALENGLSIGSSSSDVTSRLGEPRASEIVLEPKGIELDALVYEDFLFLLDASKEVAAIRIGI
ncbi:MAG: hypothetical protein Aurels2KO_31340 [Aureliella sp.]